VKAVILAAGYATRLYPLTLDRPKHLLEIGGRPLLELLLERLPLRELDGIYVVTNAKFASRFREWAESQPARIEVIDDGTSSEDDRLGAIGDLQLAISTGIDDDLLVAAGDSLFSEPLDGFVRFAQRRSAPVIAAYDVGDFEEIKRLSAIEVDGDSRVTSFEEKPEEPASTLAGIALYFYPRATLPLVAEYLEAGSNPDQPGRLVQWLHGRMPVYAWRVPGRWFDIGTPETLAEAEREFGSGLG
jgi:glucose-1-phosphate thymidylyltransferase